MNNAMRYKMLTENSYRAENDAYRRREGDRRTGNSPDDYRGRDPMQDRYSRMRTGGTEPGRAEPNSRSESYGNGTYRMAYDEDGYSRRMIGFGNAEMRYDAPKHGDEMEHRRSHKEPGGAHSNVMPPLSLETAERWVDSMKHANDSGRGERWSFDKTSRILEKRNIGLDPIDWYAIMNAMYADYCGVAMKFGLAGDPEFFACLAEAWLCDDDAVEDKTSAYYHCIAAK